MIPAAQQTVLNWLEQQAGAMKSLTELVCNINSYTHNVAGINLVREIFEREYEPLADFTHVESLPHHRDLSPSGDLLDYEIAGALHATKRGDHTRKVFLCIHLDTVYPPDNPFQQCRESGPGLLNGPGVIDAKGGAVVMLYALKALEQYEHRKKIGWEVILNTDEEIGSPSSHEFIKHRAQTCEFGLLYEPAFVDGTLVDRRKGSGNFSVLIRGRSAHSGRNFEQGRNAIVRASRLATKLHELNRFADEVTVNIARIDGGGPFNVVPDLAIVRVNVRVANRRQQQWFEGELNKLVADCHAEEGFSCELHGAFLSPPKELDAQGKRLKAAVEESARALSIPVAWRATGGASDGNKLAAVNVPNIDTLGPRGDHIHSPDEFLVVDSLVERAKLTTLILMRYADGTFSLT